MGTFVSDKMAEMLGWQVIQNLNTLEDGVDHEGWPVNCCPVCCGACSSLNEILDDIELRDDLEFLLMDHPYIRNGGWAYWSKKRGGLRINKIKRLWLKEDGSHKAICVSTDGVDMSAQLHAAVKHYEKKARKK